MNTKDAAIGTVTAGLSSIDLQNGAVRGRLTWRPLTVAEVPTCCANSSSSRRRSIGVVRSATIAGVARASRISRAVDFSRPHDVEDLKKRLGNIVVAYTRERRAADLRAHGAMTVLLKEALAPNLVQQRALNVPIVAEKLRLFTYGTRKAYKANCPKT